MFQPFLRSTVIVGLILALVVMLCASVTRAAQAPLPPILYSENLAMYVTYPGCASLLENCSPEGHKLLDGMYSIPVATVSPNGNSIAIHLSEHWAIYRTSCLLDKAVCKPALLDPTISDARIAWGPAGSVLAYMDSAGKTLSLITRGCWDDSPPSSCIRHSVPITSLSVLGQQDWSADGHTFVFVSRISSAFVMLDLSCLDNPAGCGGSLRLLPTKLYSVAWPSLSADGNALLYHADTSGQGIHEALFILDTTTGQTRQITFRDGASLNADWSSSGRYVVFSGYATPQSANLSLYVMDLARGLTALLLNKPRRNLEYPAWGAEQ